MKYYGQITDPKDIATKEYTDTKAPLASPALTGTPTAPTATAGTSTTQIATTSFVANATSDFVSAVEPGVVTNPAPINADTLGGYPASNYIRQAQVINTLTSTEATLPLSANQGRVLNDSISAKAPLASPTFSGTPTANPNESYTTPQFRNVIYSTVEPTSADGNNGDLWIVYEV